MLAGLIKSHMVLRPCLSSLVLPMLHIRFYKVLVQLRQPWLIDVLNLFPKRWNSEGFPAFFASGASRLLKLKLFSPNLLFQSAYVSFLKGWLVLSMYIINCWYDISGNGAIFDFKWDCDVKSYLATPFMELPCPDLALFYPWNLCSVHILMFNSMIKMMILIGLYT